MIRFAREVQHLFEVPDGVGLYLWGKYKDPITREEAELSLAAGKIVYREVFLVDGKSILENTLAETGEILLAEKDLIRPHLLQQAEELTAGHSVVVQGQPIRCRDGEAWCFGGFGRSLRGRPWAITETNTHMLAPKNLVNALRDEQMISEDMHKVWVGLKEKCRHPHFLADPF